MVCFACSLHSKKCRYNFKKCDQSGGLEKCRLWKMFTMHVWVFCVNIMKNWIYHLKSSMVHDISMSSLYAYSMFSKSGWRIREKGWGRGSKRHEKRNLKRNNSNNKRIMWHSTMNDVRGLIESVSNTNNNDYKHNTNNR